MADRELLAILLGSGTRGMSALDVAASVLMAFGGIGGVAQALPEELTDHPGVGPAKAATLAAAFELGQRAANAVGEGVVLRTEDDVIHAARSALTGQRRERLLVLVCDAGNRLRRQVVVSEGSVDGAMVPVREILNAVLRHDGRAFALAHNHPNGDPHPSAADNAATEQVRAAATLVGLRFLGHVVVS